MATEVINLCPERVTMSNETEIKSNSLKNMLERAGIPFNVGSTYILLPQMNHAQKFDGFENPSQRFALVEVVNGEAKAIRTVTVGSLMQRVFGKVASGEAPRIKTRLVNGLNRPEGAKYVSCIDQQLPLSLESNRAVVSSPVALKAEGRHECYVPTFEDMGGGRYDMLAQDGFLVLDTARHNFWSVESAQAKDVQVAKKALAASQWATFLK